jgi:hypothetical protein
MAVSQLVLSGGREWCGGGWGGRREAAGARQRTVDFVVALWKNVKQL